MKLDLSIEGRSTRRRFLRYLAIYCAILFLDYGLGDLVWRDQGVGMPHGILSLAGAILITPAAIRRLHDINCSGYPAVLIVIPFVSLLFLATISVWPGSEGANRYGGASPAQPRGEAPKPAR